MKALTLPTLVALGLLLAVAGCRSNATSPNGGLVGDGQGTMIGNPTPPTGQLRISDKAGRLAYVANITSTGDATVTTFDDTGSADRFVKARTEFIPAESFRIEASLARNLLLQITLFLNTSNRVTNGHVTLNGSAADVTLVFTGEDGEASEILASSEAAIPEGQLIIWNALGHLQFGIDLHGNGQVSVGVSDQHGNTILQSDGEATLDPVIRSVDIRAQVENDAPLLITLFLDGSNHAKYGRVLKNGEEIETRLMLLKNDRETFTVLPIGAVISTEVAGTYEPDPSKTTCEDITPFFVWKESDPDNPMGFHVEGSPNYVVEVPGSVMLVRAIARDGILGFSPTPDIAHIDPFSFRCHLLTLEGTLSGPCLSANGHKQCGVFFRKCNDRPGESCL